MKFTVTLMFFVPNQIILSLNNHKSMVSHPEFLGTYRSSVIIGFRLGQNCIVSKQFLDDISWYFSSYSKILFPIE